MITNGTSVQCGSNSHRTCQMNGWSVLAHTSCNSHRRLDESHENSHLPWWHILPSTPWYVLGRGRIRTQSVWLGIRGVVGKVKQPIPEANYKFQKLHIMLSRHRNLALSREGFNECFGHNILILLYGNLNFIQVRTVLILGSSQHSSLWDPKTEKIN